VIRLDQVSKQHGPQLLFVEASAAIQRGEKVGLVGPNGAGKSTIFRLITKEESPDDGQISVERGVSIGYFSQDVGEMAGRPAVAEVMAGAGAVSDVAAELKQLEEALGDPARADEMDALLARFGDVQARFDNLGGYALEARAREILAGLGFTQAMMAGDAGALSGGWKMRVALARILLMRPDAMLLDEPSNHLDLESIIWLEGFLKSYEGALVMTSHDRELMNRIVSRVIEIDGGVLTSYSGNMDFYDQQRALNEVQVQAAYERQQAMLAKEVRFIERFKAQAAKAAQVQSRVKKLDKIEKVEPPKRRKTLTFEFPPCARSGEDVVKIERLAKRYGERVIYDGLDLVIRRRQRWAVMGVNGAGKSTLLKLIAGEASPDGGAITLGAGVKMGYFAQHAMELLDAEKTVYETLQDAFPLANPGQLRTLAGCFGFSGDDIDKGCRVLSGGEKARLVLARLLYERPNFLVFDEPTNHLDIATKEMIVRSLGDFDGTMLFVSHDRAFLARLSNQVLELGPDGPTVYGGGYLEYVARSGHEAPGLRGGAR
jgi:ATPase subunit of ABC transporter with duplicated ATPase domains